jgi:hypothetical protein
MPRPTRDARSTGGDGLRHAVVNWLFVPGISQTAFVRRAPWLAMALAVALCVGVRVRLLQTPLERDEGEYAYAGQLMLQGIPPYALARNMKLPGTYAAYAAIMRVFGETTGAIHFGLLLANAAAVFLVFLLGRRLFGPRPGLAAGAAYAVMSLGAAVMGTQAHATHFVMLAALGGLLLLLRAIDTGSGRQLAASGALLGLAFLAKQHGVFFATFAALWLAWRWRRRAGGKVAIFGAAALAPFGATCLILWRAGVFGQFWFWTFDYSRAYVSGDSIVSTVAAFRRAMGEVLVENAGLWLCALAGLWLVWRSKKVRADTAAFATGLLVFSFAATTPGGYFREHYFVMVLPAAALLAGATVASGRSAAAWLFTAALLCSVVWQRDLMFRMTPVEVSRALYGTNPFPEAIRVAEYIRERTGAGAQIAILGSEPEICFYAHRRSATPFLYMYPLTEDQPYAAGMRQELIRDVESARPEYAVFVHVDRSWLTDLDKPDAALNWWTGYRAANYELVGAVDIVSDDRTEYRWDDAATAYEFQSDDYLQVYRRK